MQCITRIYKEIFCLPVQIRWGKRLDLRFQKNKTADGTVSRSVRRFG